eukprot:CAMPEP_0177425920 /NCGR_PEP_ID=MMETSP0368-20130122/73267_1 /TAXON_ID=447022 ORGANISM="Scrippsiella hangoei-like, Strain SHHI-4" /NCGR_SAMPLE_ID=MMETSP0368 /ASSEMBLY_ACC=CAM_ASM_000363 /LENGTH=118 /DNA_ID=CAMNT_0018896253 /DNA_START=192 /DNA_END=548 /DNA_ORIENTATION=-
MTLQHLNALASDPGGAVVGTRGDEHAVRREGGHADPVLVPREREAALARVSAEEPQALGGRGHEHRGAVRGERCRVDDIVLCRQHLQALALLRVPHPDRAIEGRGQGPKTIRRELRTT